VIYTRDIQKGYIIKKQSDLWLAYHSESIFVAGIESRTLKVPPNITHNELVDHIQFLNGDSHVDGILVQLPLPKHITERAICNAIAPHKDVDGFNIVNVGRFCLDMNTLIPCTPLGVQELIKRTGLYKCKNVHSDYAKYNYRKD